MFIRRKIRIKLVFISSNLEVLNGQKCLFLIEGFEQHIHQKKPLGITKGPLKKLNH